VDPMQQSDPRVHVSLFPYSVLTSKLSATTKNTQTKEELFDLVREKTQVADSRALSRNKKAQPFPGCSNLLLILAD
ncbi:MAG: hypothetical protein ACXV8M_03780, partial [Candidatus Angelobacter sp.]